MRLARFEWDSFIRLFSWEVLSYFRKGVTDTGVYKRGAFATILGRRLSDEATMACGTAESV